MIREAFEYLTTPCPSWARRLGLLKEQVAIAARYRRCKEAWEPHLSACAAAILEAVGDKDATHIVILGSGHGFDVPLEALAGGSTRISLVDAVHPRFMRRRVAKLRDSSAVSLIEADLSGLALSPIHPRGALPEPSLPDWRPEDINENSLVVSLNLLSQLALPYLARARAVTEGQREAFEMAVMAGHVEWLRGLGCPILLIAEQARHWRDGTGNAFDPMPVAADLDLGAPWRGWSWETIPENERSDGVVMHAKIGAWRLR